MQSHICKKCGTTMTAIKMGSQTHTIGQKIYTTEKHMFKCPKCKLVQEIVSTCFDADGKEVTNGSANIPDS